MKLLGEPSEFYQKARQSLLKHPSISVRDTTYELISSDAILWNDELVYYACRGPDQRYLLLGLASDEGMTDALLGRLTPALEKFRQKLNLYDCNLVRGAEKCIGKHECPSYNYLPNCVDSAWLNDGYYAFVLDYRCFNLGIMVCGKDLAKFCYINGTLACRLAINLANLVEWLIHLKVKMRITVDNLLINLDEADVTLLDWRAVEVITDSMKEITRSEIVQYYQDIAQIVLDLIGAKCEHQVWTCLSPDDPYALPLLNLLRQIVTFQFDLPSQVSDAVDYVTNLREQQEYFASRVLKILYENAPAERQPRYELSSRKTEG